MDKLSETILKFLRLDNFVQNLTGYVEDRIELMKLEIREDVAKAVARGMVMIALFFMVFLFLIFFSIGLAHFFNQYFTSSYAGFWIVAGIYGVTFLLLLIFRKSINHFFEKELSDMIKRKEK
ncbi:MAG: phage holin family protein [Cyclobacteriaceae bacterium]|nr:phage holin family protein [Cyclobacteriaceae bacterium]